MNQIGLTDLKTFQADQYSIQQQRMLRVQIERYVLDCLKLGLDHQKVLLLVRDVIKGVELYLQSVKSAKAREQEDLNEECILNTQK